MKPFVFSFLAVLISPVFAQICNPDNPPDAQVGECDNSDDALCIVNGQQHTCDGGICQKAVSKNTRNALVEIQTRLIFLVFFRSEYHWKHGAGRY